MPRYSGASSFYLEVGRLHFSARDGKVKGSSNISLGSVIDRGRVEAVQSMKWIFAFLRSVESRFLTKLK